MKLFRSSLTNAGHSEGIVLPAAGDQESVAASVSSVENSLNTVAPPAPLLRPALEIAAILIPTCAVSLLSIQLGRALRHSVQGDLDELNIFFRLLVHDTPIAASGIVILVGAFGLHFLLPATTIREVLTGIARRRWQVAGAVFALFATLAVLAYRMHPLSMDEYAPVFQAGAFARGSLTGEIPPELLPRFGRGFVAWFFTASGETGQVVSNYWPGHALLLTPFVLLGVPWLLNPLLGAASLLLIAHIARSVSDDPTAGGWAILLTIASPAFVVMSISFYSMPAHLFLNLAFAALLLRPNLLRLIAAGLLGSIALTLHNPYPHILFAAPWVIWLLSSHGRRAAAPLLLAYLPLTLLLGAGWVWLRWSLHQSSGIGPIFNPDGASVGGEILALMRYIFVLPTSLGILSRLGEFTKIWIWAVPALPVMGLLGWTGWRHNRVVTLLAISGALSMLGYIAVSFPQGHGWGSRYFYPAWAVLPILSALFVVRNAGHRIFRERVVAALTISSFVFLNAVAVLQVRQFIDFHLSQLPRVPAGSTRSVILLDTRRGYYMDDLVQNDPMLRGNTIILESSGSANDFAFMAQHFPDFHIASRSEVGTVWTPVSRGSSGTDSR